MNTRSVIHIYKYGYLLAIFIVQYQYIIFDVRTKLLPSLSDGTLALYSGDRDSTPGHINQRP